MFCPACEEDVLSPQLDGVCLTCGEELQQQQQQQSTNNNNHQQRPIQNNNDAAATTAMALLASSMENATAINPTSLLPLVNQLRGGSGNNDVVAGLIGTNNNEENINDLAGILPPEALNPQSASSKLRPVSQTALDNLKRIVLTPQSAELFDAQVSLFVKRSITDLSPCISDKDDKCLTLNAVPGEFGPPLGGMRAEDDKINLQSSSSKKQQTAAIVICSPRTTKGGKLSSETLHEIAYLRQHRIPFIAYVERGDNITFVQKALVCQRAGQDVEAEDSLCIGVIVGNTTNGGGQEIWPYIMQDTKNEAAAHNLKVPVVMIKRDDGTALVQWVTKRNTARQDQYTPCQLNIHSKEANSHTCPVCTDSYAPDDTIIRLPICNHVFHESCALAWLTKHNTCPYCRKELPTDDDDYERERRRREANSGRENTEEVNGHNFYG